MFSLKGTRWVQELRQETLERIEKNFNTLHEAIRHGEDQGCNQFKIFTHQSEMVHWFRRQASKGCDFS